MRQQLALQQVIVTSPRLRNTMMQEEQAGAPSLVSLGQAATPACYYGAVCARYVTDIAARQPGPSMRPRRLGLTTASWRLLTTPPRALPPPRS